MHYLDTISLYQIWQLMATMASTGCRQSPTNANIKDVQRILFQMFIICNTDFMNTLKPEVYTIFKNSVRTSQEMHSVSITTTNRLKLFGEIIAVYCEHHKEHINTLCGQNAEF
jgi:hypothetical protein